jgi:hypothetical protein
MPVLFPFLAMGALFIAAVCNLFKVRHTYWTSYSSGLHFRKASRERECGRNLSGLPDTNRNDDETAGN